MNKPKALLYGCCLELTIALPSLLNRAGFEVDLIFSDESALNKSKFIKNLNIVKCHDLVEKLSSINL